MKEKKYAILMIMLVMMITPLVSVFSETQARTGVVTQKAEYYSVPGTAASGTWEKGTSLSLMMETAFSFMGEEYYFCSAEDGSSGYIKSEMIELKEPEKDSSGTLLSEEKKEEALTDFRIVGQEVTFGHYEQDGDLNNGPEEIQWIVLDVQDGKSLLLSKYLLDAKSYCSQPEYVTWEYSSLRRWLNHDFLNAAFIDEEQQGILTTPVDNSEHQGYSGGYRMNGGNDTRDKIFLLSYHEAFDLYFPNGSDRMCSPTEYAIEQGAYINRNYQKEGQSAGWWWLRSPGSNQFNAAYVCTDGSFNHSYIDPNSGGVRPALWIDLEADIL